MYTGYMYFNGNEIVNHERLFAYMRGNMANGFTGLKGRNTSIVDACTCPSAHCLICDQGSGDNGAYISPRIDDAPWYDPDVPESEEFAGLFIEEIDGFDSVVVRESTDGAISGTSLGPLKLKGRAITYTGWLRAGSCCGAEYGLRWLQEALLGNNACADCALGDMLMLKCCPPESDNCHTNRSQTEVDQETGVTVNVSVVGDVYTFAIVDENQTNLVSDPTGGLNNFNGALSQCLDSGFSGQFSIAAEPHNLANNEIVLPAEAITSVSHVVAGDGGTLLVVVDFSTTSECDDMDRLIKRAKVLVDEYIVAVPVVPLNQYLVGDLVCLQTLDGIDPFDYVRLFHRTGLTDGPKVIERMGNCCSNCGCTNLKVQFTLTSELPYIYSDLDYCVQEEPFDKTKHYCIDLRRLCGSCVDPIGTKIVERMVPKPKCGVELKHDLTWCAVDWDPRDNFPPEDCVMEIVGTVPYDGNDPNCSTSNASAFGLFLTLHDDGTWEEDGDNWSPADGFPPVGATLNITDGGTCSDGDPNHDPPIPADTACLVRVTYDACTGQRTWDRLYWGSSVEPFVPNGCQCIEIAETCFIECDHQDPCVLPTQCPVTLTKAGLWFPTGGAWEHDPHAPFPDPSCNYYITNEQDTADIVQEIEVPADEFIPDCGPFPTPPPAPFTINTSCYCEPWETHRICCTVKNPGDWNDATSFIEIYTGSAEMRRVKIEAFQNPFGDAVPCPCDPADDFWSCRQPCASILVPQLPIGGRLSIDSRTRVAQLLLGSGRAVNAARYIYAADGGPFGWFDVSQCSTFCIVVSVDVNFVADDAWVSIGTSNRYLASGW